MRITDTRVLTKGNECELMANVKVDANWVWGDAFFAAFLCSAMELGEPLVIEAAVSPVLLDAAPKIFEVVRCRNRHLTLTDVEAPRRDVAGPVPDLGGHHGLFSSMGVDSSYSLLKNVHSIASAPISTWSWSSDSTSTCGRDSSSHRSFSEAALWPRGSARP